jgi:hypothetical protein
VCGGWLVLRLRGSTIDSVSSSTQGNKGIKNLFLCNPDAVFPRNESPNPTKYITERPEMIPMIENRRRPKQQNLNRKKQTAMKTKLTKIMISSLAFTCALVCLAVTMAPGTSTTAQAAADGRVCSVGTLKGLYLSSWDGYANFGGIQVPKAVMEGKRFNGDGTFFNEFGTVNVGGTTIIPTGGAGGTYTVGADCTGTLSVPNGPSFNIYVGPGAQKFWFIQTAGGAGTGAGVGVGTATRLPGH